MKALIGAAIGIYRRTPLYPHFGQALSRLLYTVQRPFRRRGVFVHDVGAFRMNIDMEQRIDTWIYYSGAWEPETVRTIGKLLPRGGVAIDVGANIGYLTLLMASQVGPEGRVVAFEPTAWAYQRLRANVELNDLPHIVTVQRALSDEVKRCDEADIPYGYRLDGRILTFREAIEMTTLDTYLAEHPLSRLDFIKCDTDGAEKQVFAGAVETLRRFRPAIHFEIYQGTSTDAESTGRSLLALLESLGYAFHREGSLEPFGSAEAVLREVKAMTRASNVVALPGA